VGLGYERQVLFDSFDMIRVINLASRRDRRAEMIAELKKVGLAGDPRVSFFSAVRPPDAGPFRRAGEHGAYLSHLAVLEEAAVQNKSVLILEDDCDFLPGARDYKLPDEWDIFYGGYDYQSDYLTQAHFIGFHKRAVEAQAGYLKMRLDQEDCPPVDGAYVDYREENPGLVAIFAEPKLGVQRPSKTDIADPHIFDRLPILRSLAASGRKLKRRVRALRR
jgi:glycosyl transferase family 25